MITHAEFKILRAALMDKTSVASVKQNASGTGLLVKDARRFNSPIYQKFMSVADVVAAFPEIASYHSMAELLDTP